MAEHHRGDCYVNLEVGSEQKTLVEVIIQQMALKS